MSNLWIVAYDISDDKIRREVSRTLEGHGLRVQYSVFECRLKQGELIQLRARLSVLLEPMDQIRWYSLCHWCESDVSWQGNGIAPERDDFHIV